jgi:hypothetical protein
MKKFIAILFLLVAFNNLLNAQMAILNSSTGQLVFTTSTGMIISPEGGANFGIGRDISGKLYNTTALTTTSGSIGTTSAILSGVISPTNAISTSVGIIYSTDINFGTYSTTTIQSNVAAGTYSSSITGLSSSTTYYAKSFTINRAGTSYGNAINFTTAAPAALITTNLILNLNANSYSGSGTTWNDLSTQSNTATLVGNPTLSSSPASFTIAANKYALTSNLINSFSAATFIAWVNPSQIQGDYTGVIFNRSGNAGSTVPATGMNFFRNNSIGYSWNDSPSTWGWDSGLQPSVNAWSMIAVTINSTTAIAYLCNASGITSSTNSVSHSTLSGLKFYIGSDPLDLNTRAIKGKIATAMIYNGALSLSEITSTFNAQKSNFGL